MALGWLTHSPAPLFTPPPSQLHGKLAQFKDRLLTALSSLTDLNGSPVLDFSPDGSQRLGLIQIARYSPLNR